MLNLQINLPDSSFGSLIGYIIAEMVKELLEVMNLIKVLVARVVPPCFRVVALGQTTGAQTVARAELQALVVALEAVPTATVFTDCQSNVCLWEWVRKYEPPRVAIAKRANEDLVGRLAVVAAQPGQQVRKVRGTLLSPPFFVAAPQREQEATSSSSCSSSHPDVAGRGNRDKRSDRLESEIVQPRLLVLR